MGWLVSATVILSVIVLMVTGFPSPQSQENIPSPTQPQAGASPMTPGPGSGGSQLPGVAAAGTGAKSASTGGSLGGVGGVRRTRSGYREWKRGDPTLFNALWKSKTPLGIRKQLGNAEVYIMLALAIGFVTVVIGCWLSDNCWSPEPEEVQHHVMPVA